MLLKYILLPKEKLYIYPTFHPKDTQANGYVGSLKQHVFADGTFAISSRQHGLLQRARKRETRLLFRLLSRYYGINRKRQTIRSARPRRIWLATRRELCSIRSGIFHLEEQGLLNTSVSVHLLILHACHMPSHFDCLHVDGDMTPEPL